MALTVVDAGVLIGFMEATDTHHPQARAALAAARDQQNAVAIPASAFAECLVIPVRRGEEDVAAIRALLASFPIAIAPVDAAIAAAAARLRARHGQRLRLPDALVVATAEVLGADVLLTTDQGWPSQRALRLRTTIIHI